MANKKFSEFTLKTSTSDVDFVVGYDGTDNVRISPANLAPAAPVTSVNSLTGAVSLGLTELDDVGTDGTNGQVLTTNGSGSFTFQDAGGGGATDLNGLSDCLNYTNSNGNSLFLGNVPSNLSSPPLASRDLVIGIEAGNSMTGSTSCVFLGYRAAKNITTTNSTVAIGSSAMRDVTGSNGTQAVAIGLSAMVGSAGGLNTVSIGCQSGLYLDASNSVVIGANAAQGGYFSHITGTNLLVLGYQADPSTATVSNEITLGNSSITALRCAVTSITSLSDERDKTEIKDLEYGLAFVDALQPREFVWDNRPETRTETDEEGNETEVEFYSSNKGKKDFGFIAQEVRELDNDTLRLVYTENEEKLELSYGKLVPILVKAIQELKEEVELLKG